MTLQAEPMILNGNDGVWNGQTVDMPFGIMSSGLAHVQSQIHLSSLRKISGAGSRVKRRRRVRRLQVHRSIQTANQQYVENEVQIQN
jgi:hypothetical protein